MPFDAVQADLVSADTLHLLARERRHEAAALWREIDPGAFYMEHWQRCALGWLAERKFDGWQFMNDRSWLPRHPVYGVTYVAAAQYFALRYGDAMDCFSGSLASLGRKVLSKLSLPPTYDALSLPQKIGAILLALPYHSMPIVQIAIAEDRCPPADAPLTRQVEDRGRATVRLWWQLLGAGQ